MSTSTPTRVAVDALGGDFGLSVAVQGALLAARDLGFKILLAGPEAQVRAEIAKWSPGDNPSIVVIDAPEAVGMGEKVSKSTLKKRSSIQVALEQVKTGQADAFFSAGNTAACWTIARLVLGTWDEVDRPALAAVVPTINGRTVIVDVGANAHCKARHLEEFAVMATAYTRQMFNTPQPRVGLMSMGEEETKGSELTKEVHEALKGSSLNFVGNVEGHDVFSQKVDIVVMDGFTGNVVLKASETLAGEMMRLLREELTRTPLRKLGAWMCRRAFRAVKRRIDPEEYGGAPLLGVKGCCLIGHGKSTLTAIKQGIRAAAAFHRSGVNDELVKELRILAARRATTTGEA